MKIAARTSCRVCGSHSLTKVIDLGKQYLQGLFIKPGQPAPPTTRFPLALSHCKSPACGLLQMTHTVPPALLYQLYLYRSGTNKTMTGHLAGVVDAACRMIAPKKDLKVLDIGCNDGTLLKFYSRGTLKVGVDPSNISRGLCAPGIKIIHDFFPSRRFQASVKNQQFDIITSIAMFYDLEDPVAFAKEIKRFLAKDGLWILEMSYMPRMLELDSYDTICHEHLEYYKFSDIDTILNAAGLKVVKASFNDINGGSIRCYVSHRNCDRFFGAEALREISAIRRREAALALNTERPYRDFQKRINRHKEQLKKLLVGLKGRGKRIHIYGASTKGNTILQFCGIDNRLIDFAAERNPDKFGAKTLGTNIPIISEEESRAMSPDYYLALPWHFKKEFLQREKKALEQGVRMIFPLPRIDIVTRRDL